MLYEDSNVMEDKLREDHEQMRLRMKQRALLSKSVNSGAVWKQRGERSGS
jgi:hypothetical protein